MVETHTIRKAVTYFGMGVVFLLVLGHLLGHMLVSAATGDVEKNAELEAQVNALHAHVERLVFLQNINRGELPEDTLSKSEMEVIMEGGIDWLGEALEREGEMAGHYRYEYAPFEDIYLDDDNIVRQTGTFFQVGEMARAGFGEREKLQELLSLNAEYFASLSQADERDGAVFRCITEHSRSSLCKLGATSLALVGLVSFVETFPEYEDEYEDLIEDYVDFILAMKKEDGGFANRFVIDQSVQSSKESSFSNGEAMLALSRYYRYAPREDILPVLEDMFAYINSDEVEFDSPLYLWAMAALRDMYAIEPNDAYIEYAKSYTTWRLAGFHHRKGTQYNMCAYVEGIGSAYALLTQQETSEEGKATEGSGRFNLSLLEKEIDFWLLKSSDLQLRKDEYYRVLKNEASTDDGAEDGAQRGDQKSDIEMKRLRKPERAHGGFLTSYDTPTQRIDYTQHCLNAYLLRYQTL